MTTDEPSGSELAAELEDLRARLAETKEALCAIRSGKADGVLVAGEHGDLVYTLRGADRMYRQLIETMSEGAAIVSADGVILYCNARLAEMLALPLDRVFATALRDHLPPADQQALDAILAQARAETSRRELNLKTGEGRLVPVYLSAACWQSEAVEMGFCLVLTDLTEQRSHEQVVAAERELRSAKAFLDRVINTIADPVFVKDDKRRFVLVNDALCTMVGRPRESLLEYGDDMFPKEQVEVFRRTDAGVLDTGKESINEESLSNLSSGEVRTIVTRKTRYIDPAGKRFLVGVIRDFTERNRAEEELRRSEERFRVIFERATDVILQLEITPEGIPVIREANSATFKILGYERDELIGQPVSVIEVRSDAAEAVAERRPRCLFEMGTTFEVKHRCKDGTIRDFECSRTAVQISSTDLVISVERDITERKRAKEALRESEERFRRLFESSLTAISMAEPGGRLIQANLAYAKMYGYGSSAEMMAEVPNVASLYANPDDRKAVQRILAEKGAMGSREMEVVRRDGTRLVVLVTAQAIRDATGHLLFYQAEHVDITERKRAEQQVRDHLEELQRWQEAVLGRESRVLEVKKEVNELLARLGQPPRYLSVAEGQEEEAGPGAAPGGPGLLKKTKHEPLD